MTAWLPRCAAPLLAGALLAAAPQTAAAQSIDCGTEYVVARGDTLAEISRRAYGTLDYYRLLYRLNRSAIGPDPSGIEIGVVLRIPCLDSSGQVIEAAAEPDPAVAPEAAPEAAAAPEPEPESQSAPEPEAGATAEPGPAPEPEAAPEPDPGLAPEQDVVADPEPPIGADPDRALRIGIAAAWPPLTDQDQAQGGMLTEIVTRAADGLDLPRGVEVYYLDDWAGLIDPMLAEGRYDLAMAWARPDCDRAPQGTEAAQLCVRLVWSEPLYEQVIGVYTLISAPPPLSASDLYGATICRPAGYPVYPLADQKLAEPDVILAQPETPRDCFQGLLDGAYQAVVMAQDVASGTIGALEAQDTVTRQPTLDRAATLHAVALSNNPRAVERLSALDAEIRALKTSGAWFEIVHRHMAAFRLR